MMAFNDEPTDAENLSRFFAAHQKQLLKYAFSILKDYESAGDAVQNSMESIIRVYDRLRDFSDERLLAYSWTIVKHACCAIIEKDRAISIFDEDISEMDDMPDSKDDYDEMLNRQAVHDAVEKLPEHYRTAIVLRYFFDLDDTSIAKALESKPENVRMTLSRGRKALRKLYLAEEVQIDDEPICAKV
jgi:RNA polymerase sigma-70 factor (ECF subfamily)